MSASILSTLGGLLAGPKGMLKGEVPDYKGPDNVPRKIVDDTEARIATQAPGTYKLRDFLQHPTLFQRYPELGEVTVNVFKDPPAEEYSRFKAFFDHRNNSLNIITENFPAGDRDRQIAADTLHEVQHKIQEKEGMAIGGTPRDMGEATAKWQEEAKKNPLAALGLKAKQEMVFRYADAFARERYKRPLIELPFTSQKYVKELVSYFLLYGEQEARAVGDTYLKGEGGDPRSQFSYPESLVRTGGDRFATPEGTQPLPSEVRDFIQQMNQRMVKPKQVSELDLFEDTTASTIR